MSELLLDYIRKTQKSLKHLSYSYTQVQSLNTDAEKLSEADLAQWEAFVARLAKVVDLFLTKYIKAKVLASDPAFEGSLRDQVNLAEKMKLLGDADRWIALRGLRNQTAHEYEEEDLAAFFERVRLEAPWVVSEISRNTDFV